MWEEGHLTSLEERVKRSKEKWSKRSKQRRLDLPENELAKATWLSEGGARGKIAASFGSEYLPFFLSLFLFSL